MKKQIVVIAVTLVALVLLLSPSIVRASEIHTQSIAEINWLSYSLTTDPGMSLDWGTSQASSVQAPYMGLVQTVNDWTSPSSLVMPYGAGGSATVNANALIAESGANMVPPAWGYVMADFIASRFGSFTVTGSGMVTFSVEALIDQSMTISGGGWADTFGLASLTLSGAAGSVSDVFENDLFSFSDVNTTFSGTQLLTVSMSFTDGQTGSFWAVAQSATNATVPEPSSMLLLGFGLAGLLGFGRKK